MSGNDFQGPFQVEDRQECMDSCLANDQCVAFTFEFETGQCLLKDAAENLSDAEGILTGVRCNLQDAPQVTEDGRYPTMSE